MSITPPDSRITSEAGSCDEDREDLLPFGVILLSPKNYPVAGFKAALDLGELRSAKTHLHVANANAIISIQRNRQSPDPL